MRILVGAAVLVVVVAGGVFLLYPRSGAAPESRALGMVAAITSGPAPIELVEREVVLPDGATTTFRMPKEFEIAVAAEDLGKARFMAESPDGRIFLPDIVDYKLSHEGRVFILEDFDEFTKTFRTKHTYLTGLRGPNSLAFYTDPEGQHWLYIALTAHLVRYPYEPGDTEPSGEPEIVAEFPNSQSPGEVSVVWHITRTIFFHDDRVYASVGSGCNSCEQLSGDMRAMIYSMKPDGTDKRVHGDGLRNTVGITMVGDALYATANGVDHLGPDRPNEVMYKIEDGRHYGWPFCYAFDGAMIPDTSQTWDEPIPCDNVPLPFAWFEPRSAPLGLKFFEEGHPVLKDSFLVALHGSFEPEMGAGYQIRRVRSDGTHEIFMDGFLKDGVQLARPVDFFQHDANSFFFTDDHGGRVYYVYANR
ncbi:MAG TPA: glucose/sorbosone dehydrogenase [Candidatus Paceibacterota bacterium]|nr:glucose/sorbosone dehydrogenase [Candidatus Paceibacterota bacterium]